MRGKPFPKGYTPWNKGLKGWNNGHIGANKGVPMPEETKKKISMKLKGRLIHPMTKEIAQKISIANKGKKNHLGHFGATRGSKHFKWTGNTPLIRLIRISTKMGEWRKQVFKRDNYTCQECGNKSGNGKRVYLETHHKVIFIELFKNFLASYSNYSPIEDKEILAKLADNHYPFWDIENGETMCKECHNETRKKSFDKDWRTLR